MKNTLLKYNSGLAGMIVTAPYLYAKTDDLLRAVAASTDDVTTHTVVLSGFYTQGNYTWYQTTDGMWVIDSEIIRRTGASTASVSIQQVQSMVNRLIECNKRIYENNLVCARFASKLTADQQDDLKGLQLRLVQRDTALRECGGIIDKRESYPKGYINEYSYLQKITGDVPTVGVVISTTAMLVISGVVVTAVAVAVYFAFRYYLAEAEKDVKFSDKLTATLTSKLTVEEFEQLKKETAGIVTKAKLRASLKAGGSLLKWIVIGVGVGAAYKAYKDGKFKRIFKTKK